MAETFANAAIGSLSAGINNAVTSFVLNTGQGALFPSSGNFRILVDSELMIVGARSGDTLSSITRGAESTSAASHSINAAVTHIVTAGSLGQLLQAGAGTITAGSFAAGAIVNADISGSAAIAESKLAARAGTELAYDQITSNVTVNGTSGAMTTVIAGSSNTYDGTAVYVEFWAEAVITGSADQVTLVLFEDSTELGQIGLISTGGVTGAVVSTTSNCRRKRTPSAASHTYTIKAFRTTNNGTIQAGAGGAATVLPAFLRVVKA